MSLRREATPVQSCLWRGRVVQACRVFLCDRCGTLVRICSDCDRGNRYCGPRCSKLSRAATIRRASRRYQRSARGRRNHRRRQKRYRLHGCRSSVLAQPSSPGLPAAKVTHHGSPSVPSAVLIASDRPGVAASRDPVEERQVTTHAPSGLLNCSMCGRPVSAHLRFTFSSGEDPG